MTRLPLVLLLAASCALEESPQYKSYPDNPYGDIEVVAVFPFIDLTGGGPPVDGVEFANLFASELVKFRGFRVIRPASLAASIREGEAVRTVDDAVRLARSHKADALVVASVTDYDPWEPPKVAVELQFLRVNGRSLSGSEIDRIVQSASWRRGPLPLSRHRAGHLIAAFEEVYDAHEERIRREVIAYAQAQDHRDSPFPEEREFLAVQSRYLQFVANQLINHTILVSPLE